MSTINWSPFTSIFENKAAGTAIIGKPGSGKTYALLNFIANELIMNKFVFGIDPKNDLGIIANIFPNVEYIDINNIKPGALNPFAVIKDIDTNTVISLISIICGNLSDEQTIAITPIINDFINKQKFSNQIIKFTDVANYLYANDNKYAQVIGTKLRTHQDSKYGPLIFSDDNSTTMHFDFRSKIISLFGMDLPDPNTPKLNENQKFNSGIVYIICLMLKELLTQIKYPTLFIMDEAHIALKNDSFASIIDEFLVLGRSLNIATILATQNASHFPDGIAQLISTKFCFKSSSDETKKFLDLFFNKTEENMADFDSIVNKVGDFKTGQCFMIDSENRSGMFKITSMLGDDVSSNPLLRGGSDNKNKRSI